MKILLSAYACEPNRGSEPGIGWNWASHLADLGHEVWVLTRPVAQPAIDKAVSAESTPGLHFVYVDTPAWIEAMLRGQIGVYAHYFVWQYLAYRTARSLLRDVEIDLIHHVTLGTITGGSLLGRLGKPFVFGPVGGGQIAPPAFREYLQPSWGMEMLRTFIVRRIVPRMGSVRKNLEKADVVLATNRDTEALARRMGADHVVLFLDSGPSAECIVDEPLTETDHAALRVLWVGGLIPRKGLPLALAAVSGARVPLFLTIAGDGPQNEHMQGWIQDYGLEDQVDWRGQVPWAEVQDLYRTHDVLLFTSLRDTFGVQLIEAMASGLPIVTLDHHGASDFVPDEAGIKVPVTKPAATVEAVARALDRMYERPDERARMSEAAHRCATSMVWENRVQAATKLYEDVLARRLRPTAEVSTAASL